MFYTFYECNNTIIFDFGLCSVVNILSKLMRTCFEHLEKGKVGHCQINGTWPQSGFERKESGMTSIAPDNIIVT